MIGERIKRARLAKGLTQQDVADGIGVSLISVSNWEVDKTIPKGPNLQKLADFLGVELSYLTPFGDGSIVDFVNSELFKDLLREASAETFQLLIGGGWIQIKKEGVTVELCSDILTQCLLKVSGSKSELDKGA